MSEENESLASDINTAEDAEALLNNLEKEEANKSAALPDEAPAPQVDEYELTVGGKVIKADRDKVLKWASMGYDAPNQIGSLRKELDQWKQKEATFKEIESKYKDVDEYVRQNPQWFQFIQQQYEQTKAQLNQSNPLLQEFQGLKQQVEELAQYKNAIVTQQEDKAYMTELETFKKQHPKVDLASIDETGKSLEYKILEHAHKEGFKSFTKAARDYLFDDILKSREEEAKEKLIKDKQMKSKLGILEVNSTPTTKKTIDTKGKNYNQIEEDIRQQYGLT
jgi:hypothetical protein